ncbi:MAG: DUF1446 domain-containing protein [Planctomycetota bacterium]|nr:DUF1446 domain-containing protein [Planctomycetota bacterium]
MPTDVVRIGNGAGFWGDNLDAPYLLARDGRLDWLTLEYLAELTLAILAHQRVKDPNAGFVTDFPDLLARLAPILVDQPALGVVTNAGGLNPLACAAACGAILDRHGLGATTLGVVTGDDVLGRLRDWRRDGVALDHMETGAAIDPLLDRFVCANVYLGAEPIAGLIAAGARLVVTGRVADASLTVGPAVARFGRRWDDWDFLASASVAGHVVECGAQATGGLWHAWDDVENLDDVGYPIAEVAADGSCVITKPDGSGGLVSVGTISEQLVYEIDDPTCYRTPDVNVDLTSVALADVGPNRVAITPARGAPPGPHLKMAAVYRDGWTASGMLAIAGRGAEAKARAAGAILLKRVARAGFALEHALVEVLGAGDLVPGCLQPAAPPLDVVLRVTARDDRRAAVARFCREFAPLVTAGPPGVAGYASGRPEPRPAFGYWPALVPRALVAAAVDLRPASEWSTAPR